jgi:hypothetical protein
MNFKSILTFTSSILLALMLLVSCSDDDNGSSDANPPSLNAPESSTNPNLIIGESTDLTFNVNVPGGYASSSVEATNGTASITSEPSVGSTSGDVVVNFTANTMGAATITLTVTDEDGMSDDATTAVSISEEADQVVLNSNITSDTTWETGKTYILGGRIAVEAGATLTIQPGVIVKGEAGTGANASALLIARDATLNANGTADAPIIFTSVADEITPEQVAGGDFASPNLDPDVSGLWGGVIVLGNAPISAAESPAQIEGIPTSDTNGLYGGDDEGDSSGTITYISIRHGGSNIGEGNEINGLTLGGVGTGTTINNVEVVANQDDGIEWFGGNVSIDGIVIWNSGDDGLDTDQDWIGTASNFIIVTPQGGSAFELDGPEGELNRGCHNFVNGVVYAGGEIENLVDFDDNTNAGLTDVYFYGFSDTYMATQDFSPVASFGGDGNCESANWEYTLAEGGAPVDEIFTGVPAEALTEVAVNGNSVGPDASNFGWTWAAQSDVGLESIGL